jgi:integrase/recombinase XerD
MFNIKSPEYNHLIRNFAQHLERLGYSKGSQSMLPKSVQEFLYKQEEQELYDLTTITSTDITDHHEYLQQRPNFRRPGGLSEMMINHHVYALKLFFSWLQEIRLIESNPMSTLSFEKPTSAKREILTQEEIHLLYEACENLKERAALHLFYGCGLRRSEGVKLNIADLHLRSRVLYVREGKGKKRRAVPMTEKISEELKAYYHQERNGRLNEKAFIVNERGTRMQADSYTDILKKLLQCAAIKKQITLHSLRHSIATHLLESGLSVEYVRDFLGHEHIDTTERYTHVKTKYFKAWN